MLLCEEDGKSAKSQGEERKRDPEPIHASPRHGRCSPRGCGGQAGLPQNTQTSLIAESYGVSGQKSARSGWFGAALRERRG